MNAILVFDPSNDLLFVKSNQLFRSKLLKYARSNGLFQAAGGGGGCPNKFAQSCARRSSSSSADDEWAPGAAEARSNLMRTSGSQQLGSGLRTRRARRSRAESLAASSCQRRRQRQLEDTSKCYTDILMLLLTPYVASLRLGQDLRQARQMDAHAGGSESQQTSATSGHNGRPSAHSNQTQRVAELGHEDDLLTKFMSSININHECRAREPQLGHLDHDDDDEIDCLGGGQRDQVDERAGNRDHDQDNKHKGGQVGGRTPSSGSDECGAERPSNSFSTLAIPVECLQDCQVVFCELNDFIFIYMQQLASVSSFKLRLLQKRCDMFARLASLLFGRALKSLRGPANWRASPPPASRLDQSLVLRRAYDCWFSSQFEPELFLEANERLIVGSHISQLCSDTLRSLSVELRKGNAAAPPASAMGQLEALETHQHALLFSATKLVARFSCLNSQPLQSADLVLLLVLLRAFNQDHGNELDGGPQLAPAAAREAAARFHYKSRYAANRHTNQILPAPAAQPPAGPKLPHQFPVFLAGRAGREVPHMVRFVALARGVTLVLVSQLAGGHLNEQLGRAHDLLLGFTRAQSVRAQGAESASQLRLGQLSRLSECLGAIRHYFYAAHLASPAKRSSGAPPSSSSSFMANVFGKYFAQPAGGGHNLEPNEGEDLVDEQEDEWMPSGGRSHEATACGEPAGRPIIESLESEERRLCRHLLRKLAELAQNNVQTYMRQTFGMSLDGHKRDALLTCASAAVRDSFAAFILEPQLRRLHEPDGAYLRHFAARLDATRHLARQQLSDYLDYLSVKASCNVTLGAPLTHDMPALGAFVYVDRARQELVMSPLAARTRLSWRELLEGDFEGAVERQRLARATSASWDELTSEGEGDDVEDERAGGGSEHSSSSQTDEGESADADQSELEDEQRGGRLLVGSSDSSLANSNTSTSHSIESIIYNGPASECGGSSAWLPLAGRSRSSREARNFLGTSQDVLAPSSGSECTTAAGSRQSMLQFGGQCGPPPPRDDDPAALLARLGSAGELCQQPAADAATRGAVDENLVKAFTAFIYNRLANGQASSFSQRHASAHQLSYFMWFKRQSDQTVIQFSPERRLETSRLLRSRFRSLPNVTCDNYFAQLTRFLAGGACAASSSQSSWSLASSSSSSWSSQAGSDGRSPDTRAGSSRGKRRVKVYCRLRELHPTTGRQLSRRQLSRVREEDELADEQLDEAIELDMSTSSSASHLDSRTRSSSWQRLDEQVDFCSFIRKQSGKGPSSAARGRAQPSGAARDACQLTCCELFCYHDATLLVHKNQPLVEAQRLASRLATLTAGH